MDPAELKALADSIRASGILQPVVVRSYEEDVFEIIAGERRWRAAQMAGLSEVPILVREASDEQMLELALVENIFREDLNPIERAAGYRQYCDQFNLSADEVAHRMGEDRSTVTNYLRILELPTEVKDWVAAGQLSMGHARCLLAIKSPTDLIRTARLAIDRDLSVRALEKLVREKVEARAAATKPPAEPKEAKRPQIRSLEKSFGEALGTKVEIDESRRKGSGRITIHYFNLDDFDRIVERLGISVE
jgi:ParB family chromosome partitioning protein